MASHYQPLVDFSQPLNVQLFDSLVNEFYSSGNPELQNILVQFQDNVQSWSRVDTILESSTQSQSKVLALNILSNTVQYKWMTLPNEQRMGIRTYIVEKIIKLSADSTTAKQDKNTLNKLNFVLVQIVKHSWPHDWPDFINELVNSSKASESIANNNMSILQLLSEEIFDYSTNSMTSDKAKSMKISLNKDFSLIYQLCIYILERSEDAQLLQTTLSTLLRFLQWIPIGYIFETSLIEILCLKFFPVHIFQNITLQCLNEIVSLPTVNENNERNQAYENKLIQLYISVITQTNKLITPDTNVKSIYNSGDNQAQSFIRYLTIFLTNYLKNHGELMESNSDFSKILLQSYDILLKVSQIDDVIIFKICLEYWNILVNELYNYQRSYMPDNMQNNINFTLFNKSTTVSPRLSLYHGVLNKLRHIMIESMAKPEEVLIVEDENGEIIREILKDTDSIVLYKSMRETLIYLTHLDPVDTQEIMLDKLTRLVQNSNYTFNWNELNCLCWAIGSISGSLTEQNEKSFLVRIIRDLLGLCEIKKGKDHKAVIASNIMYVVGQYPRFLRQHWKFLKTVVNKLFEFMHESHPGVQDMSVDTFLKIARKCRKKFVQLQLHESKIFIDEILDGINNIINELNSEQIHVFYEACGEIIDCETDIEKKQNLIFNLMNLPNKNWTEIITNANNNQSILYDTKIIKQIIFILKININVCQSIKSNYIIQFSRIFLDLLQIYQTYTNYITSEISKHGVQCVKTSIIRSIRSVKKEIIILIKSFIINATDVDKHVIKTQFLPQIIVYILNDYKNSLYNENRESDVIALFTEIINKLRTELTQEYINTIFDSIFDVSLKMISQNFSDYPDIRINFYELLNSIVTHNFINLLPFTAAQFQLIIDSIIWAIKHLDKNISDIGLNILDNLIVNINKSQIKNQFYYTYYISILNDIFSVLTDTFHKPGFRLHAQILARMFELIDSNEITVDLSTNQSFNPSMKQYNNNRHFVFDITATLLHKAFPNLTTQQIESFVQSLFVTHSDTLLFKNHLRDFLIQLKEFNVQDRNTDELFREEQLQLKQQQIQQEQQRIQSVPGLQYNGPTQSTNGNIVDNNNSDQINDD